MSRKSLEEHLLAMVEKWRKSINYPGKLATTAPSAIRECANELEEFVQRHPRLKDMEL